MYTRMAKCHIGFCVKKFPSYKDKQKQGKSYAFIDIQPPTLSGSKEYMGTDTGLPTYSGVCDGNNSHSKSVGSGGVPSATGYCLRVKCCVQTGRISPAATSPRNHTALCPGFLKSPVAVACVPQVIKARTRALYKILAQGTRADATQAPRCSRTGRRAPPCLAKQG